MWQPLGNAANLEFRDAQDLGHFGKGAAALEGREAAHHGRSLRAVLLEDQVNDVVFAVVRKINVNVGQLVQLHPLLVQETSKIKIKPDRADLADAQTIADQRVGGAATRDPVNPAPPALLQQVPNHQEIFLVTDLGNDGQLLFDLRADPLGPPGIAAGHPFFD